MITVNARRRNETLSLPHLLRHHLYLLLFMIWYAVRSDSPLIGMSTGTLELFDETRRIRSVAGDIRIPVFLLLPRACSSTSRKKLICFVVHDPTLAPLALLHSLLPIASLLCDQNRIADRKRFISSAD